MTDRSRGRVARRPAPGSRRAGAVPLAVLALAGVGVGFDAGAGAVAGAGARGAEPACAILASVPEGRPLAAIPLGAQRPELVLAYVHSVTRTPVIETYRVDGRTLTQTAIRFSQHGPGLPTQPGPGETWQRRDGQFEVTMARAFAGIRMRVHADQRPVLETGGTQVDLAQWGNRAIDLRVGACEGGGS